MVYKINNNIPGNTKVVLYQLLKHIVFIFLMSSLLTTSSFGQLPKKALKIIERKPRIFLDSLETDMSELQTLNPFDISNISVVQARKAKKILGDKGLNGAIYITTVKEAKISYWNYFSSKSDVYKQLLNSPQADTVVQYILNGKLLSDTAAPGKLFLITNKNFKSLSILDKEKLPGGNVIPKRYIVAIIAKQPKGLVKITKSK